MNAQSANIAVASPAPPEGTMNSHTETNSSCLFGRLHHPPSLPTEAAFPPVGYLRSQDAPDGIANAGQLSCRSDVLPETDRIIFRLLRCLTS